MPHHSGCILQVKVAKSSSWRGWLGSWRSSSGGHGAQGEGSKAAEQASNASMDAAVAALATSTNQSGDTIQQVELSTVLCSRCNRLLRQAIMHCSCPCSCPCPCTYSQWQQAAAHAAGHTCLPALQCCQEVALCTAWSVLQFNRPGDGP